MTNEEIFAAQREYRAFSETTAGGHLHHFRTRLTREIMDGELERTSMKKNRDNEASTRESFEALTVEIKRLQARDALADDLLAALIAWRDQETSGMISFGGMDRARELRDAAIAKATGAAS